MAGSDLIAVTGGLGSDTLGVSEAGISHQDILLLILHWLVFGLGLPGVTLVGGCLAA